MSNILKPRFTRRRPPARSRSWASRATAALAAAALAASTFAASSAQAQTSDDYIANAVTAEQWTALSAKLDGITGRTTSPLNVVTNAFTNGALLGNGDLGAVSGGSATSQQLYFGRADFFGRIWSTSNEYRDSILRVGTLQITGAAAAGVGYEMVQDIRRGEVRTTLTSGLTTRTWLAEDDNIAVSEISNPTAAAMTVTIGLTSPEYTAAQRVTPGVDRGADGGTLWGTRNGDPASNGYASRQAFASRVVDAELAGAGVSGDTVAGTVTVAAGASVTVATVFTSASGTLTSASPSTGDLRESAVATVAGLTTDRLDELHQEHEAWWKDYWLKSSVSLGDSTLERYYYGAQYVMGAASRPGKLAPGLWASWITGNDPGWQGKYFLNYDWQAAVYGAASSNRTDQLVPFYEAAIANVDFWQPATARAGYEGSHTARTIWPYVTLTDAPDPVEVAATKDWQKLASDQKSNSVFALLPAIWYYEYTRDTTYLRDELYPALREVDEFYRDFVIWDDEGQRWVFDNSAAHESAIDTNPSLDLGYARKLWNTLIDASKTLGTDADLVPVWESTLDHLSDYPVGAYQGESVILNAEKVYFPDNPARTARPFDPGNQPVNLEGPVFPGEQINLGTDADERALALTSLRLLNSWTHLGGTGAVNGFPKIYAIAARLGWPAADLKQLIIQGINANFRASNLTRVQSGGGIETSGTTEAINSMLLQSEGDVIRLFPVWPSTDDAAFNRLRTKGAELVSSSISDGVVGATTLTSEKGGTVNLMSSWAEQPTVVRIDDAGNTLGAVSVSSGTDGVISFDAQAGETYVIRGEGVAPVTPTLRTQDAHLVNGLSASVEVTATVSNPNAVEARVDDVELGLPDGWTATVRTGSTTVEPGGTATLSWRVRPPSATDPGSITASVGATATAGGRSWPLTGTATITVHDAAVPFADAVNGVGITSESDTKPGAMDGASGNSYSAQALAQAGATFTGEQTVGGIVYRWPGVPAGSPDHVAGSAVISVDPVRTSKVGLLGARASANNGTASFTLLYSDGSQSQAVASFPNWANASTQNIAASGVVVAFDSNRRNTQAQGGANVGTRYRMYSLEVPADPDRSLVAVVLPADSLTKVFAIGFSADAAAPAEPGIVLDRDEIAQGESLIVDGAGFLPGAQVTATVHSAPVVIGTETASTEGAASWTWEAPRDFEPGSHEVVVTDAGGNELARAAFTVTATEDPGGEDADSDSGGTGSEGGSDAGGADSGTGADASGGSDRPSQGGGTVGAEDGDLAITGGGNPTPWIAGALLLVIAGGALLIMRRRRAAQQHEDAPDEG